ncbi:hypothetical protein RJ640_003633 [Escallonia rubra]|uniref:TFIIB-type domain-containing protein n=1 Tax=Escallonia rubra TaxID=112253 RepID=A0AA88UQ88_9ASTE|nr:hypothetical protein RJ640_003633 [Escallonia rubra]
MEGSRPCKNCGSRTLESDNDTGSLVCSSCGVVQDFDNYQAQLGGISGPTGTYIRVGTAGSGTNYSYKETKIYKAQKLMEDLLFRLEFSPAMSSEVKAMVERITEGEYGQGDWLPIFIGACAYVVMRKNNDTVPITQVAAVVGCDVHELGRMVGRVVEFLGLKLPEFDVVDAYKRAIRTCPSFIDVSRDKVKTMLRQGVFLVQCLVKWFVTTGRRPLPVVAAVIVFVAQLNGIDLQIGDLANELHVAVSTCRLRYKELLERLVEVAQALPWGKDITVKNVMKNAPFVIQYMEMKSMCKGGKERDSLQMVGVDMDVLVDDCLRRDDYTDGHSHYLEAEQSPGWSVEDLEKLKISHECLSAIYSKFVDEVSENQSIVESGVNSRRIRKGGDEFHTSFEWWKGNSDMSKKLFLKQILDKDVGLEAMPPSFVNGRLACQKRRAKIEAAKLRIKTIMNPWDVVLSDGGSLSLSKCVNVGKKRRKMQVDMDWEDFVIETLLLHKVNEEEIEKGYYNTLLDLHVFDSWGM